MQILIVEDDPGVAALLRRSLSFEGYDTNHVADGLDAVARILDSDLDLVILDLMIPGIDGIEVAHRVRTAERANGSREPVPILMLTARDSVSDRVRGLDAGADDYLVKPFSLDELLARVRAMNRRRQILRQASETEQLIIDDVTIVPASRQAFRGHRELHLTPKEFDLLTYFARNPNIVLTRSQIMDRFWGTDQNGDSNVLEVFVGNLRRQLEREGEPRVLVTVRGVGYTLRAPRNT